MFPRILLDDGTWMLTADWFGLGKLQASRVGIGMATAPPGFKTHLLDSLEALKRRGFAIHPREPETAAVMRFYAAATLKPMDLMVRAAMTQQSPDELVGAILESGEDDPFLE